MKEPASKAVKTSKKHLKKPVDVKGQLVTYRKDFYKHSTSIGIKKYVDKKCAGQIFSFGGKGHSQSFLQELADKVIHDLRKKACGNTSKEDEIALVARYKCWKAKTAMSS